MIPAMYRERKRLHLDFLDGVRGLAALYVLLHHAAAEEDSLSLGHWLARGVTWLGRGHYAVAVFIVLSGFCLMMPVVRDEGRLRGGFRGYILRRARRILPPYYAAMALSLALIACCPRLSQTQDPRWKVALPAFSLDSAIVPHLLLVHNLSPSAAYRIDPPMWSVATEWQIYFSLPILLFIWRRWGVASLVASGFCIGLLLIPLFDIFMRFLYPGSLMATMCPWYFGLFALGMAAASAAFGDKDREVAWADRSLWFTPTAILCGLTLAVDWAFWDTMVGILTVVLLLYCASFSGATEEGISRPPVLRMLESRAAVTLGTFSYSTYLIHYPILAWARAFLVDRGLGPTMRLVTLLLVISPGILVASYAFHLAFERPFMAIRPRSLRAVEGVSVVSPAP
jgi:peptidoglycan/LPS O-acetylase OafA/YrhL